MVVVLLTLVVIFVIVLPNAYFQNSVSSVCFVSKHACVKKGCKSNFILLYYYLLEAGNMLQANGKAYISKFDLFISYT